jgi:small conductance mechanosensitive channel
MPMQLSSAWNTATKMINGAIALIPSLILGTAVFLLFLILGSIAKSLIRRFTRRRKSRQGVGLLLGRLAQALVLVLGFLIALSIIAPSFHASDLIKMLGIGSVAIGFAFQNILQNFLAGILILIHEPFQLGDLISVTGIEGNVQDIQARATLITTKEGREVFIPNATLFTNPVAVAHQSENSERAGEIGAPQPHDPGAATSNYGK